MSGASASGESVDERVKPLATSACGPGADERLDVDRVEPERVRAVIDGHDHQVHACIRFSAPTFRDSQWKDAKAVRFE